VPTIELGNITLSDTTTSSTTHNMTSILDFDMAVDSGNDLFTDKKVRGHSLALSTHRLRTPSMSSSKCNEKYHVCVKRHSNRMDEDKPIISVGSIQVEYAF